VVPTLRAVVSRHRELLAERGIDVDHVTIYRWVQRFTPMLAEAARPCRQEVAVRAGHTSVSFTLDRYGHLYPEADTTLRDRLEALHWTVRPADGVVIQLSQ
jgi:transposase, IS6 family